MSPSCSHLETQGLIFICQFPQKSPIIHGLAFDATELTGEYYDQVMQKIWNLQNQLTVTHVSLSPQSIFELEDELVQWQIVSMMYSVSVDHSAAIAAETAASYVMHNDIALLQTEMPRYDIQPNFVHILRQCKEHLEKNNVPASHIPV